MRVSGEKQLVRLSEADLEPSPVRPVVRVAPLAALGIWVLSTGLAAGIYLEWLPVAELFESDGGGASRAETRVGGMHANAGSSPGVPKRLTRTPAPPAPTQAGPTRVPATEPRGNQTHAPAAEPEPQGRRKATEGAAEGESQRVIRGSYHTDNTHWVGGW